MRFIHLLKNRSYVRIVSADIWSVIQYLNQHEIIIHNMRQLDALTYQMETQSRELPDVLEILRAKGNIVTIEKTKGPQTIFGGGKKRPILFFGVLVMLSFLSILPRYVLFVEVDGNKSVESSRILEAAHKAGVAIWSIRKEIRSEYVKNRLLSEIPELQWAGINLYGCRAVISVRESHIPQNKLDHAGAVRGIYAIRDGIVRTVSVLQGTPLCESGQTVNEGQLLISGYTDGVFCIRGCRAVGEVYADTIRKFNMVTPLEYTYKTGRKRSKTQISLIIGKKRINLWKDSGIWDSTCGRINKTCTLMLPGGFYLPIAICIDVRESALQDIVSLEQEQLLQFLHQFAQKYLAEEMIAGTINDFNETVESSEALLSLQGVYYCTEMIGREHIEEMGDQYGKDR